MKMFKSSSILFFFVIFTIGYIYFFEYKKKIDKEAQEKEAFRIIKWNSNKINSFVIKTEDRVLQLDLLEKNWYIQHPIQDRAENSIVENFLSSLTERQAEDVVREGEDIDYSIYGLEDPSRDITLVGEKDEELKVYIGDIQAFNRKLYVRVGDEKKIFLVGVDFESDIEKKADDLRMKSILRETTNKYSGFKIEQQSEGQLKSFILNKKNTGWEFSKKKWEVDESAVRSYLKDVQAVSAVKYLFEDKKNSIAKQDFMTERELFKLTFLMGENKGPSLIIHEFNKERAYITHSKRPTVYEISNSMAKKIMADVFYFRNKKVPFQFKTDNINEIQIKNELTEIHLIKGEEKKWIDALERGQNVDQSKVDEFINQIKTWKAVSFLGKENSIKKQKGRISLKDKEKNILIDINWGSEIKELDQRKVKTNLYPEYVTLKNSDIMNLPFQTLLKKKDDKSQEEYTEEEKEEKKTSFIENFERIFS